MKDPFSKGEIWAEHKFIPADPKRKSHSGTTKKTKFQKFVKKLKELWRILK
jgi:hypothetical protein